MMATFARDIRLHQSGGLMPGPPMGNAYRAQPRGGAKMAASESSSDDLRHPVGPKQDASAARESAASAPRPMQPAPPITSRSRERTPGGAGRNRFGG